MNNKTRLSIGSDRKPDRLVEPPIKRLSGPNGHLATGLYKLKLYALPQ